MPSGIATQILLYTYNIVLISKAMKELKKHRNTFKIFCINKCLLINIDRTNMMDLFNTTQACATRSKPYFFLGGEKTTYI